MVPADARDACRSGLWGPCQPTKLPADAHDASLGGGWTSKMSADARRSDACPLKSLLASQISS